MIMEINEEIITSFLLLCYLKKFNIFLLHTSSKNI